MAVRKLGKGWQCDFYAFGERIRRIFPTRKDAEAYEGKIKSAIKENKYFDIKRDSFEDFKDLSQWYLQLEDVKRKKSYQRDCRSVVKLNEFFGNLPLRKITPVLIAEYQSYRLSQKSYRGSPTRPASVNRELSCLKTIFNKAIKNGLLSMNNPVSAVKFLPEKNERDRLLSLEEWERYKSKCPSWFFPIALMAYYTAMRKGEIINLRISRLDLKNGFIRLRSEDTKTSVGRIIPIHPELLKVLKETLKVRPLNHDFVFHKNGKQVTPNDIRRVHERVCREAGIENFVFHDFRHDAINRWRQEGHDYFRIMAVSGHKTISVFKRYNLVTEEELRRLVVETDSQKMVNFRSNPPIDETHQNQNSLMISGA